MLHVHFVGYLLYKGTNRIIPHNHSAMIKRMPPRNRKYHAVPTCKRSNHNHLAAQGQLPAVVHLVYWPGYKWLGLALQVMVYSS